MKVQLLPLLPNKTEVNLSSTKIDLEYPYNTKWKYGYLNINSEGRRTLTLYNSPSDRSSTQYARYLLAVSLGRFLTKDEHVDHIDNDKTNDSIENIRVVSLQENNTKESKRRGIILIKIICPVCKTTFSRRKGLTQMVNSHKGKITCCSKYCACTLKHHKIDDELRELVSEESIILEYKQH